MAYPIPLPAPGGRLVLPKGSILLRFPDQTKQGVVMSRARPSGRIMKLSLIFLFYIVVGYGCGATLNHYVYDKRPPREILV